MIFRFSIPAKYYFKQRLLLAGNKKLKDKYKIIK